jgi:hypothetical protein
MLMPRSIRAVCSSVSVSLALLTILSCGCGTSSVVNEWREPSAAASAPYRKVLVVALGKRVDLRRQYEGEFARDLRQRGAEAIEGSALLRDDTDKVDRDALLKAVADSGADAVAITRLVKMDQRAVAAPSAPPTTSLHGYYSSNWSNHYEPSGASGSGGLGPYVQTVATLETSLFDAKSAQLVWRATTETVDADAAQRQIPGLVKKLVDAMAKAKMIP